MKAIRILSAAEQVAGHLRQEVLDGGLDSELPGIHRLAAALGVNHKTMAAAMDMLRKEGVLVSRGTGRRSRIAATKERPTTSLRIGILGLDPFDRGLSYMVEIQHTLEREGHRVFYLPKSLTQLAMDVRRIARMVGRNEADAWLVLAGSRAVLEWFSAEDKPVMALFGRRRGLAIANVGPDMPPAFAAAANVLLDLGHRRIVMLVRRARRMPVPGASEQAFLDALAAHEVATGPYHLPDWDDSVEGLQACLRSLFRVTPPTALIVQEIPVYWAAQQFLAGMGLRVPQDVSLVCAEHDPSFDWCKPTVSYIRWDSKPLVRRIQQWASNVRSGKSDLRQTLTPAEFVPGGTIGPARER